VEEMSAYVEISPFMRTKKWVDPLSGVEFNTDKKKIVSGDIESCAKKEEKPKAEPKKAPKPEVVSEETVEETVEEVVEETVEAEPQEAEKKPKTTKGRKTAKKAEESTTAEPKIEE
jgi:hypothetical protein